ncbi:hypothetical protein, partial [Propioniciclava flava]
WRTATSACSTSGPHDQDPVFKEVFYRELLPELNQRGKTVVAITHDDRYFGAGDRLLRIENGRIEGARTYEPSC